MKIEDGKIIVNNKRDLAKLRQEGKIVVIGEGKIWNQGELELDSALLLLDRINEKTPVIFIPRRYSSLPRSRVFSHPSRRNFIEVPASAGSFTTI